MRWLIVAFALMLAACNTPTVTCSVGPLSFIALSATCQTSLGSITIGLTPAQILALLAPSGAAARTAQAAQRADGPAPAPTPTPQITAVLNTKAQTVTFTNQATGTAITIPAATGQAVPK